MKRRIDHDVDVVVVGAGPAGSTLSALVSMQGHRVLVLDKDLFPRGQTFESLAPSTMYGICRFTGATAQLERSGLAASPGTSFRWGGDPDSWAVDYAGSDRLATGAAQAHHIERARLDQILVDTARRQGVEFRDECEVVDVLSEDGRTTGLSYVASDGVERRITSQYLVDASGSVSPLRTIAGAGGRDVQDRGTARYGYFSGRRGTDRPDNTLVAAFDRGWFWCTPLGPTLTGVGVVIRDRAGVAAGARDEDLTRDLAALVQQCPAVAEYLNGSSRIGFGPHGRDLRWQVSCHSQESFWRPGMVVVGDAACAVPPLPGIGVHLATYGALLAARSINTALLTGGDDTAVFEEFDNRYHAEHRRIAQLLDALRDHAVDRESLAELLAGVSSRDPVLLQAPDYIARRDVPRWFTGEGSRPAPALPTAVEPPPDTPGLRATDDGFRWRTILSRPSPAAVSPLPIG
ncbi:hypothetical protein GCM10010435_24570 [Winogradskya consettensis]|uniref:Uncharacterized protein n=1 Tax=Winogradskya consettensis TaxID=113560 RepID=A0A919T332_9ACTN|nr:NAD(P)/FAD-dependent oxidoreductase [Actinoplanes consettensis]GIM82495.1 hypothetical protein Aco04nite_81890 [Actinoplanes consettensis]